MRRPRRSSSSSITSQGCSSCPPADALLTELAGRDGVIALALHVDYWDYLGWKDEFARPQHTARQRAYAKAARSRSIFTPEMVVQGEERLKGHDAAADHRARSRGSRRAGAGRAEPASATATRCRSTSSRRRARRARAGRGLPGALHPVRGRRRSRAARTPASEITYTNIVTDWETIGHWDGAGPVDLRYEAVGDEPLAVIVQGSHMGPVLTAAELQ